MNIKVIEQDKEKSYIKFISKATKKLKEDKKANKK